MIENKGNLFFEKINSFNDVVLMLRHDASLSDCVELLVGGQLIPATVMRENLTQLINKEKANMIKENGIDIHDFNLMEALSFYLLEDAREFENTFEELYDIVQDDRNLAGICMNYRDGFEDAETRETCITHLIHEIGGKS